METRWMFTVMSNQAGAFSISCRSVSLCGWINDEETNRRRERRRVDWSRVGDTKTKREREDRVQWSENKTGECRLKIHSPCCCTRSHTLVRSNSALMSIKCFKNSDEWQRRLLVWAQETLPFKPMIFWHNKAGYMLLFEGIVEWWQRCHAASVHVVIPAPLFVFVLVAELGLVSMWSNHDSVTVFVFFSPQ